MVDKVNTTPLLDAINLHDLVVEAPVGTTKPGEKLPKQKAKQIKAPSAEQNALRAKILKEKAAKFAPKLTQPLASMPPSEQVPVQTAPIAKSDAPHYYAHMFIMEQLDKFVDNPFDGEVASLPIPPKVISKAIAVV